MFSSSFQDPALAKYKLTGVADAFSKHKDSGESKGVKAHFRLDESGLLNLDQVSLIKKHLKLNFLINKLRAIPGKVICGLG